jgi:hypothetical protein
LFFFGSERGSSVKYSAPEAEILDEIHKKVLIVFLLAIHSHLCSFASRFCSSNSRNLLQFLQYTVKEKGGKPDRKQYLLPYGLRNPYRNLKSEENSED